MLAIGKIPVENTEKNLVELKFVYVPPEEYVFKHLYYSGSIEFNVTIRKRANEKGYTLTEKGMFH